MKLIFEGEAEKTLTKMVKPNTNEGGRVVQGNGSGARVTSRSFSREENVNTMAPRDYIYLLQSVAKIQVIIFEKYDVSHLLNVS